MIRFIVNNRIYLIWLAALALAATLKGCFWNKPLFDFQKSPAMAKQVLTENHQLKAHDLLWDNKETDPLQHTLDTLIGQHLIKAKKDQEEIRAADVSPWPLVHSTPDSAILVLSLSKNEAVLCQWLHKGAQIVLCKEDSTGKTKAADCSGPVYVAAVHSSTIQAPGDYLLLRVPLQQVKTINHFITATKRAVAILQTTSN